MKGVIIKCLKDMVVEKFGSDKWNNIMQVSEMDPFTAIKTLDDIEDSTALKILQSTCDVLNWSLSEAADAFGDYWVNVFAPKIYAIYYEDIHSAKEFILNMDDLHIRVTSHIVNSKPPRFEFEWKDEATLIVTYKSHRGLIDLFIGLAKGVGRYFNEKVDTRKISDTQVEITFEQKPH